MHAQAVHKEVPSVDLSHGHTAGLVAAATAVFMTSVHSRHTVIAPLLLVYLRYRRRLA